MCDNAAGIARDPRRILFFLVVVACLAPPIASAALPTIWGTPATGANVGIRYTFVPSARDADGDRLIFWIQKRPSWASFDWRTGRLTGIPGAGDVGVHPGVVIGVSDLPDRARVRWLPAFKLTVNGGAGTNRRPAISGAPPRTAVVGQTYAFTPSASDPDGDPLTFWSKQRPSWATLDRSTGRLSGTPGVGDVGVYSNIVIGVTDGALYASLAPYSITVAPIGSGSATLTWTPPTRRTDGSPLTNLAGYRVLWGTSPGSYPNSVTLTNPGLSTYVVANLAPATYYFVVRAFDSNGRESTNSNAAQKTIWP
jgi:hypothetical protein